MAAAGGFGGLIAGSLGGFFVAVLRHKAAAQEQYVHCAVLGLTPNGSSTCTQFQLPAARRRLGRVARLRSTWLGK